MTTIIVCIPADNNGNKLFLKDISVEENRMYVKYRSTYNDIPFQETELFDDGKGNAIICGEDGTVLWRFNKRLLDNLYEKD